MSDNNVGNITQLHRQAVAWIVEAAEKKGLALLEVTETKTGEPAVLLVAISTDEEGKGGRMAPLARLDMDFENDFTPPEGVETVVTPPGTPVEERITPVELEIHNAGEGC
jgi:hypothetical protein